MNKTFQLTQHVYSEDVDQYGIVYHANYVKYFERARTEWLMHHGITLTQGIEEGVFFVVKTATLDFIKPLKLHQSFTVDCAVKETSRTRLTFAQTIRDTEQKCCCTAEVVVVTINPNGKAIRLPETIKEIFV